MESSVLKLEPRCAFYFPESFNDVMASLEDCDLCSTEMIQRYPQSFNQSMPLRFLLSLSRLPLKSLENFAEGGTKGNEFDVPMRRLCLTGGGQDHAVEELKPLGLGW